MAQPASAQQKKFRRARLWLASLIALTLGAGVATFVGFMDWGRRIELLASDVLRKAASLPDEPLGKEAVPITVVCIDDSALLRYGHWPWPWTRLADVTTVLSECGAGLVVFDIEFLEADPPRVIDRPGPDGRPARRIVETVPILVEAVRDSGHVVLPFNLYLADRAGTAGRAEAVDASLSEEDRASREKAFAVLARRHTAGVPQEQAARLPEAAGCQPMIAPLAEVCEGSGYTTILHDADGAVRRVPLLTRYRDEVFPHLMLEAAGTWRFGPDFRVALVGNRFILSSADGQETIAVHVGPTGDLDLRWPSSTGALTCINVKPVLQLADWGRYRHIMRRLDKAFPDAGWSAAAHRLDEARRQTAAGGRDAPSAEAVAGLEKRLAAIEEGLAMNVATVAQSAPAPGPGEKPPLDAATAQACLEGLGPYLDHKESQDAVLAELRKYAAGRMCVIGFFGTGLDLHTTPIGTDLPGVTVYPAGIRTILSGVAFGHLERWQEWVVTVLVAWFTAVATCHLSTLRGAAATLLLAGLIAGAGWVAAAKAALLVPVAGPVLAVVVAYAGVTTYHQLTEASSRRWITRVFEQYNSADLVEEIVRNPDSLRLGGEVREVTILFSDIAGFTPLSEKLAPERLVALLNRYLSVMTTLFQAEKGSLDKYQGDGIMAFFGAPVVLPDHALRGVRAALAMHAALPEVNGELAASDLLPEGATLAMRVGLSSGPAVVGNFGSEQRFNYTCSGDTVNLAARLEEANRWLGTKILVPESTRDACGQAILFRPLGLARIRGKEKPLALFEPLAAEPAPDDLRRLADAFGRAIDALQAGDLAAAETALAEVVAVRPDDGPAKALKARIEAVKADQATAQEPWNLTRSK